MAQGRTTRSLLRSLVEEHDKEPEDYEGWTAAEGVDEDEVPKPTPPRNRKQIRTSKRKVQSSTKVREAAESAREIQEAMAAAKPSAIRPGNMGKRVIDEDSGGKKAKARLVNVKAAAVRPRTPPRVIALADDDRDLLVGLNMKFEDLRKRVEQREANLALDIADQIASEGRQRELAKSDVAEMWRDMNPGDPSLRKCDDREFQLALKLLNLTAGTLRDFQANVNHWDRTQRLDNDIKGTLIEIIDRFDEIYGALLLDVTDGVEVALAFRRRSAAYKLA